jgi:hypothetical protein
MKKLTFFLEARVRCTKSINVPVSYKTAGKSYEEIYDEVNRKYGSKDHFNLDNGYVDKDEFDNMAINLEKIRTIFKQENDKLNLVKKVHK